jgi:hypothetical protein
MLAPVCSHQSSGTVRSHDDQHDNGLHRRSARPAALAAAARPAPAAAPEWSTVRGLRERLTKQARAQSQTQKTPHRQTPLRGFLCVGAGARKDYKE